MKIYNSSHKNVRLRSWIFKTSMSRAWKNPIFHLHKEILLTTNCYPVWNARMSMSLHVSLWTKIRGTTFACNMIKAASLHLHPMLLFILCVVNGVTDYTFLKFRVSSLRTTFMEEKKPLQCSYIIYIIYSRTNSDKISWNKIVNARFVYLKKLKNHKKLRRV